MNKTELETYLQKIQPADGETMSRAEKRQAELAKPPGSLGKLETISVRLAGITGKVKNRVDKSRVIVFAADNGVVSEGVSCTPQSVTLSQSVNMTFHKTGMSTLAKYFGCEVRVVDVGIAADADFPGIVQRKVRAGTRNLAVEAAMTDDEVLTAIAAGIEQADSAKRDGIQVAGIGEMGIGNTTTSAAVLAALTGLSVEAVTGRGGGLTDSAFEHKREVIAKALTRLPTEEKDPLPILAEVGGLDLAAMTGCFLGCAANRIPVVVDGYISIVAALCACRLAPNARDYIFLSHESFEIGYRAAAAELGAEAYLNLGMRLGEGSGCPIMFQIMRAACSIMCDMATFAEASIDDNYLDEIRKMDAFSVK